MKIKVLPGGQVLMDKIEKALKRLNNKERQWVKAILVKVGSQDWRGLDIKTLRGREDIFRVRKGDLRIIYQVKEKEIYILKIERRRESTYRNIQA